MGFLSALQSWLGIGKRQVNIIVVGLDNSGKTTILNGLRSEETRSGHVVPTVGMSNATFSLPGINFTAFDMSGQGKYRNLWESYYARADGIIFVVDSSDRLRMSVARDELWMLLDNKDTRTIPLVVMANKSDLSDSISTIEISNQLGLDLIRTRAWKIQSTSALQKMSGVQEALAFLSDAIKANIEASKT